MCVITMKTMTEAQRARRALLLSGIDSEIVSLDKNLTRGGCSYGLSLPSSEGEAAERVLIERKVPYGRVMGRQ